MDSIGSKPAEPTQGVSRKLCLACNRQYEDAAISHCPHDSTQLVNLGRDEVQQWLGKTINGKYKVLEAVGKGGMGTVFRAEQLGLGRFVAVKMLKAQLSEDKVSVKRFEQEATASAALQHSNLIMLHDFGMIDDKQPYLVMEFLEGESLASIIKEHGSVNPVRCLRIFTQVMEGLKAAHQKGVVHRDIKPSNIILTKDEHATDIVKVVDFGLAKLMPWSGKESQHLTKTGEVFGSPIYMSPEQCQGKKLEPSSDIYSVGVTLYEALTGAPPFKGRNVVETASMHISSQPPPFELKRPDLRLSNKLQSVIFKALDKEPSRRYLNMDDFKKALTDAISGPEANGGFRGENEAADVPVEATQPVRKSDLENCKPVNLSNQRQMEQRQEENRRKLTIVTAGLCIVFVIAMCIIYYLNTTQKPSPSGTSGVTAANDEGSGILRYLVVEPASKKGHSGYLVKEAHLMPKDSTDPAKMKKFVGDYYEGRAFFENLKVGAAWNCKSKGGAIVEITSAKDGQASMGDAADCVGLFIQAATTNNTEAAKKLADTFHSSEEKFDIAGWKRYRIKPNMMEKPTGPNDDTKPYSGRILPQAFKVISADNESVDILVDKNMLLTTADGKELESPCLQRFTVRYFNGESWKIAQIWNENEENSAENWKSY